MGGVEEPEEVAADTSPILPMEAKSVKALPEDGGWQFEPKWDGFRCLAFKSGDHVAIYAKSGKPLGRFFPEVVEAVRALPADDFVHRWRAADPVRRRLQLRRAADAASSRREPHPEARERNPRDAEALRHPHRARRQRRSSASR